MLDSVKAVPTVVNHACGFAGGEGCERCQVRPLSICGALEDDELSEISALAHRTCIGARNSIFSQGDAASSVYNITSGTIRLSRLLPDGRRQIVGFALPGDFLGLSLAECHSFAAETVDSVTVCRFSRTNFSDLVDRKPHLLRRLHSYAMHELSIAQEQMVVLGRRNAEEKVAAFLVGLRDRQARLSGHTSVHVPLPMSRQDIADFLGLTIETVSRTFTRLANDKNIVVVPDGVRLLNVERLEKLAAG